MCSEYKNKIAITCYCKNINIALHTNKNAQDFTPRTCQCDYCKSHGASWISDPEGTAKLTFQDRQDAVFYRFGHKTSDFVFCRKCGVLTIALCEFEGKTRAVINITAMTDHEFTEEPIKTNFDGETIESRLERRTQNWMGNVIIEQ